MSEERNIFVRFDEAIAQKCYDLMLSRSHWRSILKLFEYLFHGLPWFSTVALMYYFGDRPLVSIATILFRALILDLILIGLIKAAVRRKRPRLNRTHEMDVLSNRGPDKFSFPSGHSSRAIMMANLLVFLLEGVVANSLGLATLAVLFNILSYATCLSRVLLLRHFFTDVLGGIAVGYMTYFFVILFLV